MKKLFVCATLFVFTAISTFAQMRKPLIGSGNVTRVTPSVGNFSKLDLIGLGGQLTVNAGAPTTAVSVDIDDNLRPLLEVKTVNETLTIRLKGNENNHLWLEENNIRISIDVPTLTECAIETNGKAQINGIDATAFSLRKDGNGDVVLNGKTEILSIVNQDNGSVWAENVANKSVKARNYGNGDVKVRATLLESEARGNGEILNANAAAEPVPTVRRVRVTFVNTRSGYDSYRVAGRNERGRKFSYGLGLGPNETQSEYLPVGTQVSRNGKVVATIKDEDDGQIVKL